MCNMRYISSTPDITEQYLWEHITKWTDSKRTFSWRQDWLSRTWHFTHIQHMQRCIHCVMTCGSKVPRMLPSSRAQNWLKVCIWWQTVLYHEKLYTLEHDHDEWSKPYQRWNKDKVSLDKLLTAMARNLYIIIMSMTYLNTTIHLPYSGWVVLESKQKYNNNTRKIPKDDRNTYKYMYKYNKQCNIRYAYTDRLI